MYKMHTYSWFLKTKNARLLWIVDTMREKAQSLPSGEIVAPYKVALYKIGLITKINKCIIKCINTFNKVNRLK